MNKIYNMLLLSFIGISCYAAESQNTELSSLDQNLQHHRVMPVPFNTSSPRIFYAVMLGDVNLIKTLLKTDNESFDQNAEGETVVDFAKRYFQLNGGLDNPLNNVIFQGLSNSMARHNEKVQELQVRLAEMTISIEQEVRARMQERRRIRQEDSGK